MAFPGINQVVPCVMSGAHFAKHSENVKQHFENEILLAAGTLAKSVWIVLIRRAEQGLGGTTYTYLVYDSAGKNPSFPLFARLA
jgi:hypothetical protein